MAIENFTTYTEVDPNNRFVVTAAKIAATGVTEQEDAYVYDDKGAAHFGATFEHLIELHNGAATLGANVATWCVSNTIDDSFALWDSNQQALLVRPKETATDQMQIAFMECEAQDLDFFGFGNATIGDDYWLTVERTGETAAQLRVYSDSGRTSLLDTMTIAVPSGRRYRYVFGINAYRASGGDVFTLDVENLDLQEAVAGNPWYYYQQQAVAAGAA